MRLFLTGLTLACLLAHQSYAQQQVLPGAPTAPVAPAAQTMPPAEVLGASYSVELVTGTAFIGKLVAISAEELRFETSDLGIITVQRSSLRQMILRTEEQARRGYDYVGNGTRMFFAPTARNLRKGEGYVQDIDIYLAGINYGITDNFSVGLLVPIIPNLGAAVVAVTPKVSVPLADKFNVGAGLLYLFVADSRNSGSGGIGYGVGTYGTADANVTFGLGYGFATGSGVSNSPVGVLGGNLRVSRRLSVVDETYFADGGLGGLLGLRLAAARASGSLGFFYNTSYHASDLNGYPLYFEFAYRFGKVTQRAGRQ